MGQEKGIQGRESQHRNALRVLRKSKGMSQEVVADCAGMHRNTYNRLEAQPRNLTLGQLARIARVLGSNAVDLCAQLML